MNIKRVVSANNEFQEITSIGDTDYSAKFSFEVRGDAPALFEGHWWKKDNDIASIYISSSSGCPVGCQMCGVKRRFLRKATAQEMISQFEFMYEHMFEDKEPEMFRELICKFIYMGEPLLNIEEVDKALRYIAGKYPTWKLLINTTAPRIDYEPVKNWMRDFGGRMLVGFSVHKLTNKERNALIPFEDKLSLDEIAELGKELTELDSERMGVSYAYLTFNKERSEEEARALADKFSPEIWLPIVMAQYDNDGKSRLDKGEERNWCVDDFIQKLKNVGYDEAYGFYCPIEGVSEDIMAGCGQFMEFQAYCKKHGIERNVMVDKDV